MRICVAGSRGHLDYLFDALPALPTVRIVGIHAADPNEFAALRDRCRDSALSHARGWETLLDAERPDIAVVCGPFEEHAAMCVAAFERGISVFCEKPVALTLSELSVLRAAWESSQRNAVTAGRRPPHFAAMMGLRYDAAFYSARHLIASGAIGEVRLINAQKSYKLGRRPDYYRDRRTYGGTIPWVGSHAIDWIRWFSLGAGFVSVDARHSRVANGGNGDLETSALCRFELSGDLLASASIDFLRPDGAAAHGDDRIRVVGTRGVVEVRGGEVFITDTAAAPPQGRALPLESVRGIFSDFVACVEGETSAVGLDGEETLAVTEACLLARASADEHREFFFGSRS